MRLSNEGKQMLRLFPALRHKDNLMTEFFADKRRSKIDNGKNLDPSDIPYKYPDFGFNDNPDL